MSGEYPFTKFVSPAKCIERPWDLWVSELGHGSPRADDATFVAPPPHARKADVRRLRRPGLQRLRAAAMSQHGLFPQRDNLNAAVCHMCGVIVKCSAAHRHLQHSHPGAETLPPPPQPVFTQRIRTRLKKEHNPPLPPPPPPPVDRVPLQLHSSPVHTAAAPLSRPPPHYLEEAGGEVQVCVESGELPVVSIQDTEELPLGEHLTDDIFEIMNSEGIQSAGDITDATDWKNIIRDIGNLQDINFTPTTDSVHTQDSFPPTIHAPPLPTFTLSEADLSSLQFASTQPPPPPPPPLSSPVPKPPPTPSTPKSQRKTSKTKFNQREYDVNKHCGVLTADNKPCTHSLTCKAHALSLRRLVEGRAKPFDTLLAEHRAARLLSATPSTPAPAPASAPTPAPPLLVNNTIDLTVFNGLTTEQQVNDIYSLLSVDDPNALLTDPSAINSLFNQPLADSFVMPEEIPLPPAKPSPIERIERPERIERDRHERTERSERSSGSRSREEAPGASDVTWYGSCPRPLGLCTFNAAHAGGAVTLGKKFATVRSNIKSSLSRSQCKNPGATNNFYYGQSMSLSKSVHLNQSKTKPEVRRLIVCSASASSKEHQTLSEMFGGEARPMLNGHVAHGSGPKRPLKPPKHAAPSALDLGFSLDPLLADEKC